MRTLNHEENAIRCQMRNRKALAPTEHRDKLQPLWNRLMT